VFLSSGVANTLSYRDMSSITALNSFIVQAPGVMLVTKGYIYAVTVLLIQYPVL
jgi:hypothetical protein